MPDMRDMLTPEILAGMEKWMAGMEPPRTLPQAVNEALGDWLTQMGVLPYVEHPEGETDPDA
ncbi:hypothetical protein HCU64_06395 [Methylobacterium sp. C25]|uniref:hypothetical protein n=1 Tax=Methylobacterium sp. C25 TaxID=2721622 RepID=UPI001F39827C|nr:hypothetical protein [Methylobacterium sp. C25]MCE4223375.1 hypothetical protein [Methylobacterium sp. C25]